MTFPYILDYFRRPKQVRLPKSAVEHIVRKHHAQEWFIYIFKDRAKRWDVWETCFWIDDHVPRNARILEAGCGCGMNLLWLGQRGFQHLSGLDCDPTAIAAGKELASFAKLPITYSMDDGLQPKQLSSQPYDVIFALNFLSLVPNFKLDAFLRFYGEHLTPGGYLLFDMTDSAYNHVPDNQYCTSDWNKPLSERRESEYRQRFSSTEIEEIAQQLGWTLEHRITHEQKIPKQVYMLRKSVAALRKAS